MIESGKFPNKHGVAIIVNKRWKNKINWVECAGERVVELKQQTANNPGKRVLSAQWIPGPSSREKV